MMCGLEMLKSWTINIKFYSHLPKMAGTNYVDIVNIIIDAPLIIFVLFFSKEKDR